jgi:hypothetical protein
MATMYRKRKGRFHRWHSTEDCPDWPEEDYIEEAARPPLEEQCNYCVNAEDETAEEDEDNNDGDDGDD